jgi:hypothetical protein
VKIDVKGAFVQTPMSGEPTYVKLDPKVTKYAKSLYPEFVKRVEADGCLYMRLLKALYGCVQASALWYALIWRFLEDRDYTVSPTDPCVFVRQVGEKIFILLLYVDDILGIVDDKEARKLKTHLEARFGMVQFEECGRLSYLGMEVDITDAGTSIDMSFYVRQLVESAETKRMLMVYDSPGTRESFVIQDGGEKLQNANRVYLHSTVAKLLYLAKRARPDVLTVVIFLCTRVQDATVEDERKLIRVLGYLKNMLSATERNCAVVAYVDAAFALHHDSKSHTGVIVYVGGTLAYVASRKQKSMSKSPTEAELIALTDTVGLIELFQEFVEFVTKKKLEVPMAYQDCKAVVSLVTIGGGKLRTKHLRARMHLAKEMVDEGRLKVIYKEAENMVADGFSKPYDPAQHKAFAELITKDGDGLRQQVGAEQT